MNQQGARLEPQLNIGGLGELSRLRQSAALSAASLPALSVAALAATDAIRASQSIDDMQNSQARIVAFFIHEMPDCKASYICGIAAIDSREP